MDIDKIRCIATVWVYITPFIIILSYILVMLVKEMVSDEQDSSFWYVDTDNICDSNLFE